ncbi:MAG: T9SS type A sorting domain-containing protein [Flavobacteriales bacterium]|nr:T9SS type A sorting domain-containing protein [Flavobacteriales bacterium]
MKKIFTLMTMVLLVGATQMNAQRYLEEIFDEVEVTTDIQYGTNASVLAYAIFGEAIPEDLIMDIYEPSGDTETERPLILYFHTGNFLPHPDNLSPSGLRTDSATVEICNRFARMGYVVASCDYRLGWNPLAETQEERVNTLINAAYRGVQDARTCARYFRMDAEENGNEFGIDTERIAIWGQGTGGYISLAASTLDDYTDILLPKFTLENDGSPIPMVIEQVNGDIFGTSFGVNPLDNDTLCYVNHPGYDSDFGVCVNMGGALGDISWLDDTDGPFISFQSPSDPFAPYEEGIVIVPGVNLPVVEVQGSYLVQQLCATLGNNDAFANTDFGDPFTAAADEDNDGYDGLFPFVRPEGFEADTAPWEFWDPDNNPNSAAGFATNPDMTAEKARTFIDTIQAYAAPRMMCALNLPDNPCALGAPENDLCDNAIDVNPLFGQGEDQTQMSDTYTNVGATAEELDLGFDCFEDNNGEAPSIESTVWFTFTGDGEWYNISTSDCGGTAEFFEGDTQMAIYEGPCVDLGPVACNEDIDFDNSDYYSEVLIETTAGTEYYIMVDGYDYTAFGAEPATGDFCLEITQTFVNIEEVNSIGLNMFPNPATTSLNLTADQNIEYVEIFDMNGRIIESININATRAEIDVEAWNTGVYTVRVQSGNSTVVERFVKK